MNIIRVFSYVYIQSSPSNGDCYGMKTTTTIEPFNWSNLKDRCCAVTLLPEDLVIGSLIAERFPPPLPTKTLAPPKCFLSEKSHFVPAHSLGFFFAKGRFSLKTLFSDDFILMWKKIWNRCKNLLVRKSYECLVTPFPSLYLKCFSSSTVHFTIIEILKVVWKFIFVTGMRRILIWTFLK